MKMRFRYVRQDISNTLSKPYRRIQSSVRLKPNKRREACICRSAQCRCSVNSNLLHRKWMQNNIRLEPEHEEETENHTMERMEPSPITENNKPHTSVNHRPNSLAIPRNTQNQSSPIRTYTEAFV